MPTQGSFMASGGGISGDLFRSIDWSKHPLGPVEKWSPSLKTTLNILFHSRHPMFLWWGPELFQFYNDAYLPSFGVGKHPKAMGQRGEECWPEIWPIISPQINLVMNHGGSTWNEEQLVPIFRNGKIEDVYWTYGYSPVVESDNSIGGTLVVCTEVTKKIFAQNEIKENEERLNIALTSGNLGFWDWNAKTGHVVLSPSLMTDWQIDPSTFKNTLAECLEKIHPEDRESVLLEIQKTTLENTEYCAEYRVIRSSGEVIWINAKGKFILDRDGKPERLIGTSANITSQVLLRQKMMDDEEQIKGDRAKLEAIFYGTDSPMVLFRGPNFIYEMANQKYLSLISDRDVLGKPLIEGLPEVSDSKFPALMKHVYETGEPTRILEGHTPIINLETGKVEDRYFDTTFARISDGAQKPYLIIGHAMDVTERVKARKELEEAKREAENANSLKSSFLANMSHEIRTPLGAILGFADVLKGSNVEAKERRHYLDIITRNGNSLINIIDDILDLSKVEAGKLEIEERPISLVEISRDVIAMFSDRAQGKGIELLLDENGFPKFKVESDAVRIRQILVNIVGNAIKFTTQGTVKIAAKSELLKNGKYKISMTVADTGVGMPMEQAEKLFQPFTQADNGNGRKFGGTGLGLALSKKLGKAMGGDVSIHQCEEGKGCTFEIEITARKSESNDQCVQMLATQTRENTNQARLLGKKILIVDDSPDNRALISLYLGGEGAITDQASDGEQGIEKALKNEYDLVLMDIQMPGKDGYEALSRLRTEDYKVPVLALTAHAMKEERNRAINSGFSDHIPKPVNRNNLIETILTHTNQIH